MDSVKNKVTNSEKVRIGLQRSYEDACKDNKFKALVKKVDITKEEAMQNTSKFQNIIGFLLVIKNC